MKKIIFSSLLLLAGCLAYSQVGIKGGATFSSIADATDEIEEKNIRTGFHAGLMFEFPVHEWFAIRPEAVFTRKGAKYDAFDTEVQSRLDYIDVPVLAVFKPFGGPFLINVGPQFSYLVSAEYEYYNDTFDVDGIVEDDRDDYETWDFGLAVGAGLQFQKFLVEVRYNRGLRNLEKSRNVGGIEFGEAGKNYNLQASVGVFF